MGSVVYGTEPSQQPPRPSSGIIPYAYSPYPSLTYSYSHKKIGFVYQLYYLNIVVRNIQPPFSLPSPSLTRPSTTHQTSPTSFHRFRRFSRLRHCFQLPPCPKDLPPSQCDEYIIHCCCETRVSCRWLERSVW